MNRMEWQTAQKMLHINQGSQKQTTKNILMFFLPFITGALYKYKIYFVKSVYGFYRKHFFLNVKLASTAETFYSLKGIKCLRG